MSHWNVIVDQNYCIMSYYKMTFYDDGIVLFYSYYLLFESIAAVYIVYWDVNKLSTTKLLISICTLKKKKHRLFNIIFIINTIHLTVKLYLKCKTGEIYYTMMDEN